MPFTLTINESGSVLGLTFPTKSTVTADGNIGKTPTVAAAKTGTLTTRTDDNTGELTMAASHGITTGARLDLYWDGGSRRGITVGTVATNAVPIDLGAGDNLPIATTVITAMVPTEEDFTVDGDNVTAIAMYSDQAGQIVFCETDDTEVKAYSVGGAVGADQSTFWTADRDATNPLAGGAITKVYFSHGTSSASANMRAVVLYD